MEREASLKAEKNLDKSSGHEESMRIYPPRHSIVKQRVCPTRRCFILGYAVLFPSQVRGLFFPRGGCRKRLSVFGALETV